MNLYKVHNLPVSHPENFLYFRRTIPGSINHGMYAALPTGNGFCICMATQGFICMMTQALYPVECPEWCILALFIQDIDHITKHCLLNLKLRHAYMAISLDG